MSDSDDGCCGCGSLLWFIIGAVMSWLLNHSLPWACIHGLCGGFYLLYAILFRWSALTAALERILK